MSDKSRVALSMGDDLDKGMAVPTSVLEQKLKEVREQQIGWHSYHQSHMISDEDYAVIKNIDRLIDAKTKLSTNEMNRLAQTFNSLLSHLSKDQTIQYILVIIDDMINNDSQKADMFRIYFRDQKQNMWSTFLNLLTRPDAIITNVTACIISKLACLGQELMQGSDLTYFLTWLKDQLRAPNNDYLQSIAKCLQRLLRHESYRIAFYELDGVVTIVQVLGSGKQNFQIQYQLTFCLWVMTFNTNIAEKMNKYSVIPTLADILSESVKEKVTRITLAVFRNLIEKPQDSAVARENCIQMVQCKVLKQLEILAQRKFEDEDTTADIEFLNEKLQTSIQDLSSFEEYCSEVKSGRMEWSPVHKSEKFWRENSSRLNEKNYELLKILIDLLEKSKDALVLSVACHDIGEYVRHYVRGKRVLEQLGGKQWVMQHLTHDDPNVRYEALLAVQKLMVHNWEYLGKQLEKDAQRNV